VQKDQGKEAKLTEGREGWSCGGKGKVTTTSGGEDRVLAGRDVAEALRATGHLGSMRGGPVKVLEGLGRFRGRRRRRIVGAEWLTGGSFVTNSR
jgi:hypothetical protein